MCVLAFAWQAHPRWRLLAAGNRDEYHARPAQELERWEAPAHLIAGRDLQSGGTWLGVSEQGRFAVVTNLRGFAPPDPNLSSRGALVTDYLAGTGIYADPRAADLSAFNPVNLIVADQRGACFMTNRPEAARTTLASGLYGLSNGKLDEPWPKTMRLKSVLLDWITGDAADPETLFDGLREEILPDIGSDPAAPSDVPQEPNHSPIFIRDPVYGTRCSTVVAIDVDGRSVVLERRFSAEGVETGRTKLSFVWRG
ncbi:MAG: NRDE family protein [Sphingomonas sp.]